jgi:hypothetical protein
VLIVASGAAGIGTARSAICWDALAASATECPVVVVYISESKESAAFVLEWDDWQAMGVHLIPLYISDGYSSDGSGERNGGGATELLSQQDRCALACTHAHACTHARARLSQWRPRSGPHACMNAVLPRSHARLPAHRISSACLPSCLLARSSAAEGPRWGSRGCSHACVN